MTIIGLLLIIIICCIGLSETFINYPVTMSTRRTRNMTYDMRCLPKIKKHPYLWNYSVSEPNHYGKCLRLG